MASKSTDFEVEKRINKVFDMLAKGVGRADIVQFASKNGWDVSDRTVDTYIKKATGMFRKYSKPQKAAQTGLAIVRLNNLYESNMRIQDYKAALATQKEINELLGLYAPKKTEQKTETTQTNVNIAAENAHDASNILKQLADLGAIPSPTSATHNHAETE